jgi:hypothetical protein
MERLRDERRGGCWDEELGPERGYIGLALTEGEDGCREEGGLFNASAFAVAASDSSLAFSMPLRQ